LSLGRKKEDGYNMNSLNILTIIPLPEKAVTKGITSMDNANTATKTKIK